MSESLTVGQFVGVAIKNKKGPVNIYMAQITDLETEGVAVKYMTKGFGGSHVWPLSPEESLEPNANVWPVTEPSKITERGHFRFDSTDLESIKSKINGVAFFR